MKTLLVLCIFYAFVFARTPLNKDDAVYDGAPRTVRPAESFADRVLIDSVGNIRSILGSQGKSIAVSGGGEAIAVIYGAPSSDPNNTMLVKIAYSVNGGLSWTTYGPFSASGLRIYNDVAYTPNFHTNPGELWFAFQFCTLGYNDVMINVMREENVPAAPSFSVPVVPANAQAPATYPWQPSLAVMKDDPTYLVLSAWSYLANGNGGVYCWICNDANYSWTDTIAMTYISEDGSAGALAAGTDDYLFYAYLDYYTFSGTDSTPYPHYIESTDGGYTWSEGTPITVFPANVLSAYWWYEFDCIIVRNEPWVVYNDVGTGGTGGPHIAKATGSPGNWTWAIWHQDTIGFDSTWVGDTLFYCAPSQYPSLSYDPVLGRVLASCKSDVYVGNTVNWAMYDGAHIQGVYTDDGGGTWHITDPLSTPNTGEIGWYEWNAAETADWLGHSGYYPNNYSIWVLEDPATEAGELYFESWSMPGIEETGDLPAHIFDLAIFPSVVTHTGAVRFTMQIAGQIWMSVYDVSGRIVQDVFDGYLDTGTHEVGLRTDHLSSGTYFAVLRTEFGQQVEKFIVVR
jgi:hypothetical protein